MTHATRAFLALVLAGSPAAAADVFVPGDAATIQGGIDLAGPGDRVIVAPGVYDGPLIFSGIGVEVIGAGPDLTVIDGSADTGSPTVWFTGGGPGTDVLRGVTVRDAFGDAVVVLEQSAEIDDCAVSGAAGRGVVIETDASHLHMAASVVTGCGGIGVFATDGGTAVLDDCEISSCSATGVVGGAIPFVSAGDLTCNRCVIRDNVEATPFGPGGAAGCALVDCVVQGNTGELAGGGYKLWGASGTVFIGNHGTSGAGGYEGDLVAFGATVTGATFIDNTSDGLVDGAALNALGDLFGASTAFRDCVFVRNDASLGAFGKASGSTLLERCTVIDCDALMGSDNAIVRDSIVRGGVIVPSAVLDVSYSNVEGGAPGVGNIDVDPLFVDPTHGVVCLGFGSPCIDAGNPAQTDPDGSPRDMGAVPFTSFCDAGSAKFGTQGLPGLSAAGATTPGASLTVELVRGVPSGTSSWVLGASPLFVPLKGGVLVPTLDFLLPGLPLDGAGALSLGAAWPAGIPAGTTVWLQAWIPDPDAPANLSASNGLALIGG